MARAVGIDIGSKSLKILQLETASGKTNITHFFDLELSFGDDEEANSNLLIEAISTIFKDNNLDRNNVVLSLPTQDCILREITVDFSQDDHIKKIIKYEAEKYLHSYPIEQVIIDFEKLNTDDRRSRLFLAAVPKTILSQRLGILETCNLDPISVDLDITTIANVADLSPDVMDREMVLVIDFGASATKLIVMNKNKMKHVRAIRLGASIREDISTVDSSSSEEVIEEEKEDWNDIDWDLESELIVTLPIPDGMSSERMFLVHQTDNNVNHEQQKSEIFDRLVKEIRRTLFSLPLEKPIELICLTGGGSQLQGITEFLETKLKIETRFLDFSSSVLRASKVNSEVFYSGGVALGCALKGLGRNKIDMDFRKEEFVYTKRFEMIKYPLAVFLTILLMVISVMAYQIQNRRITIETKYNTLCKRAETIFKRALPGKQPPEKTDGYLYAIYRLMRQAENQEDSDVPEIVDSFERWKVIFDKFNKVRKGKKVYIIIREFELKQDNVIIGGFLGDNDTPLDFFKQQINDIPGVDPDKTSFSKNTITRNPPVRELPREYRLEFHFKEKEE